MAIETTHADDRAYDIKIPERMTEANTGKKIIQALRKWAERDAKS